MINDLIERMEKATGPDGDLDFAITQMVSPGAVWCSSAHLGFTASIDAALDLVPATYDWIVGHRQACQPHLKPYAQCWTKADRSTVVGEGATPALALCIAALRARAVGQCEGKK